jgi:hypothetical protein
MFVPKYQVPSIVWTEIIDEKFVKLAALSFRVILPSMSDARWVTEALKRVRFKYDLNPSSRH